jgi:hypothetical protein
MGRRWGERFLSILCGVPASRVAAQADGLIRRGSAVALSAGGTPVSRSRQDSDGVYAVVMPARPRRARVADVHELAMRMPGVSLLRGRLGNPIYQVAGGSFVFFRNPRPDAVDPVTGERYKDVIVFWVESEADKQALVQDEGSPFFTTSHFDGHPSVLLRASRIGELTVQELTEVVQDAWLSRASPARAAAWLSAHAGGRDGPGQPRRKSAAAGREGR